MLMLLMLLAVTLLQAARPRHSTMTPKKNRTEQNRTVLMKLTVDGWRRSWSCTELRRWIKPHATINEPVNNESKRRGWRGWRCSDLRAVWEPCWASWRLPDSVELAGFRLWRKPRDSVTNCVDMSCTPVTDHRRTRRTCSTHRHHKLPHRHSLTIIPSVTTKFIVVSEQKRLGRCELSF